MTAYPPTHCCNPAFQYVTAEETKKSGYLAMRFARIVAAREVAEAEGVHASWINARADELLAKCTGAK